MIFSKMTDEEFNAFALTVRFERERRDNLARIPNDITQMVAKYRELGGEESVIADAVAVPEYTEELLAIDEESAR